MTITVEKKKEILTLLKQGETLKNISEKLGVSRPTIIKIRKDGLIERAQSISSIESSETSESVTLGSEDTDSQTESSSSSNSSKSDDSDRRIFIQQRAFTEKVIENRGELENF